MDWFWRSTGVLLGCAGFALLLWSLFADRSRGHRRCPGRVFRACWYDMSGATALTCPECGHKSRSERELLRTRRRWGFTTLAVLTLIVGGWSGFYPNLRNGQWHRYVPSTVLIELYPWVTDPWVHDELEQRIAWDGEISNVRAWTGDKLWDWQWARLTRKLAEVLDDRSCDARRRIVAGSFMLMHAPNPGKELPAITRALGDDNAQVREMVRWGVKACRFEFAPHSADLIGAIAPFRADEGFSGRDGALTIELLEQAATVDLPPSQVPARGQAPNPRQLEADLFEGGAAQLARTYRQLGIWPRYLMWYFSDDCGPLTVTRHDAELDGIDGIDCILHIEGRGGTHGEFLVFTQEHGRWTFAGYGTAYNNTSRPAAVSVDSPIPGHFEVTQFAGPKLALVASSTEFQLRGGKLVRVRSRQHEAWDHVPADARP